jgi:GTPase SAR1 family protein
MEEPIKERCFKITLLGDSNVGKTAIITKLVNKYFPIIYEPTTEIENYSVKLNLTEEDIAQKTYVNLTVQDTFGLNNSLLNKLPELITSQVLREKRDHMTKIFKDIMFTSNEKRKKISCEEKGMKPSQDLKKKSVIVKENIYNDDPKNENESKIERLGFIFVCDSENMKSLENVTHIIKKLHEIEKTNNLIYPKCIFFNKADKVSEKFFKENLKQYASQLEAFKNKFKIDFLRVSALTGQGLIEGFRRFLSKIHQKKEDEDQNDGIKEPDDDDDSRLRFQVTIINIILASMC